MLNVAIVPGTGINRAWPAQQVRLCEARNATLNGFLGPKSY